MIKSFYDNFILKYPIFVLILLSILIGTLGYYSTKLEIDASAETLLLDDDKDLKFTREVNKRYYNPDFLVVTYSIENDELLSDKNLKILSDMSKELRQIKSVNSITSILTVPILQSPIIPLTKLVDGVDTLETGKFDKKLVKKELLNSELYSNNLVSPDFKSTALLLNLKEDKKYFELLEKRNSLLSKKRNNSLNKEEKKELHETILEFKKYRDYLREKNENEISAIREILEKYTKISNAKIFLGGVSMIANDIVGYVKNDLLIYGSTLVLLLIGILYIIFRHPKWVILPIAICILSVITTAGVLGLFNLEVTVISSNFISLQLIITLAIVLHLIVRYRELNTKYKHASQYKLVINTMLSKLNPSFFAIITTITGFASLVLSSIEPVKNLGLMMSAGIAISLFLAFLIFPIILIKLPKKDEHESKNSNFSIITSSANLVEKRGTSIIIGSFLIVLFSLTGASKLIVENSFINYFKQSTEIYKGMEVIDKNLGGTTPLDVIIRFKDQEIEIETQVTKEETEDEFDDFEDEYETSEEDKKAYWFTKDKMETITAVHNYLNSLEEVGKVQSFASLLKLGKILNDGSDLDGITLALLYSKIPEEYKNMILAPYIDIENNEARVTMRIIDSNDNLRRNELIAKINNDLRDIIENKDTKYNLSNLMILYNNMLQSLFDSQISTLGFVLVILFFMFLILFRSIKVAFIAILANIIPISSIFGIMGYLGIPLDIMTITIAAISIGIGVDDTIHYIHRFKDEYKFDHNYINAMKRSHESIGYAMYYTSLVVIVGFSILVLSNLIPTIYFGILTVIVMATILASALLLLPKLIIILKPFNK